MGLRFLLEYLAFPLQVGSAEFDSDLGYMRILAWDTDRTIRKGKWPTARTPHASTVKVSGSGPGWQNEETMMPEPLT